MARSPSRFLFVSQSPDHALAPAARIQLGSVIVERGRIKVEQAKKPRPDQAALLAEARKLYDDAYQVFVRTQSELKAKLDKLKIVAPDDKQNTEVAGAIPGGLRPGPTAGGGHSGGDRGHGRRRAPRTTSDS